MQKWLKVYIAAFLSPVSFLRCLCIYDIALLGNQSIYSVLSCSRIYWGERPQYNSIYGSDTIGYWNNS